MKAILIAVGLSLMESDSSTQHYSPAPIGSTVRLTAGCDRTDKPQLIQCGLWGSVRKQVKKQLRKGVSVPIIRKKF